MTYPESAQPQPGVTYAPASTPATPRNKLGIASVIAGGVTIALQLVFVIAQVSFVASQDLPLLSLLGVVHMIVAGLISVTAVVLGVLGLMARDRPKGVAGVGLGLGIATVVGVLTSVLYTALLSIL